MNKWEYIPMTQKRPETEGYFSDKQRPLLEFIVSTQLSDLLSDYGRVKEEKLDVSNPNTREVKSYFGLYIPAIRLREFGKLTLGQFPWREGENGETGAFGTEEGLYALTVRDAQNKPTLEVAVWDPSIETDHRIYDSRGRRVAEPVLHEMYDALTVVNKQLALHETITAFSDERAPSYPIPVIEPEVEVNIIDFNSN